MRTVEESTSHETRHRTRTRPDLYPIAAGTVLAAGLWLWYAQFLDIHAHTPAGMEGAVRDQCFAVVLILGGMALFFRAGGAAVGAVVGGICAVAGIGLALTALFLTEGDTTPTVNAVVTGVIAAFAALATGATRGSR